MLAPAASALAAVLVASGPGLSLLPRQTAMRGSAPVLAAPAEPVQPGASGPHTPEGSVVASPVDDGRFREVSVLSLEGDTDRGTPLTVALRRVIRSRGHDVLGNQTLTEVKAALGCDDYESSCLTGAAGVLQVDAVIFGTIRKRDGAYAVELFLVRAGEKDIAAHVSRLATPAELEGMQIHGKAQELAELLWPMPKGDGQPAGLSIAPTPNPPAPLVRSDFARTEEPADAGPTGMPIWASVGLIAGGIDTALAIGVFVGTGVALPGVESKVKTLATASRNDDNPANDIPDTVSDYCEAAEAPSTLVTANSGDVVNAAVAEECGRGATIKRFNTAAGAYMTVAIGGLVSVGLSYFFYRRNQRGRGNGRWSATSNGARLRF